MQYKKYIPDVIGLVVLTALIGALIAALSIFVPHELLSLLPKSTDATIIAIMFIYLAWAVFALHNWHDPPPIESWPGKWVGLWVGSWAGSGGISAILSVALAVLWYWGFRLYEALFIQGEHENSKIFDIFVALVFCPGYTFICIAGYVRELFQKKIVPL